ncbi:MAG: DUF559 domain-containing protein, partial [Actinomycetota bacterium]
QRRQVRPATLLVPHRSHRSESVLKGDVPISKLATAVVEAFGCLDAIAARNLLFTALGQRRISAGRLLVAAVPGTRSRPALLALLGHVAGGSHSEAELRLLEVVRAAGLPEPVRQLRVRIGSRSAYLDLAFEPQRVAIEVDGRRWHFCAEQRSADIRRDVRLSAAGWLVLRFLYEQIVDEPRWVADRIAETLAARAPDA